MYEEKISNCEKCGFEFPQSHLKNFWCVECIDEFHEEYNKYLIKLSISENEALKFIPQKENRNWVICNLQSQEENLNWITINFPALI